MAAGSGATANITMKRNAFNIWEKEYKIQDQLGSTRVVLNASGRVVSQYDYEPFGKVQTLSGSEQRLSWIDKEQDEESDLGDFGVRKYDDGMGRFMSIDPLWEKYRSLSPYSYSANNPLILKDPNGQHFGGTVVEHTPKVTTEAGGGGQTQSSTKSNTESKAQPDKVEDTFDGIAYQQQVLCATGELLLATATAVVETIPQLSPDSLRAGVGLTVIGGAGVSKSAEATLMSVEGNGSVTGVFSTTNGYGAGVDLGAGGFIGPVWYFGDDSTMTVESVGGDGWMFSAGGGPLGNVGLTASYGGGWLFIGVTAGASLTPISADIQKTNTTIRSSTD